MKRRIVAGLLAVGAVAAGSAGVSAPAQAAPAPSVKVCASWFDGRPFAGSVGLSNRNWWELARLQRTAPNGCTVFRNVRAHTAYRVTVQFDMTQCLSGMRPDGTRYQYGTHQQAFGSSRWATTGRSGQTDLGRFRINVNTQACM